MRRQEEPLVTREMIGLFVVFGADFILLFLLLAAVGVVGWSTAVLITILVFAVFGGWVGARWYARQSRPGRDRQAENTKRETGSGQTPLETLKERYAAGELSDEQFEEKLEALMDSKRRLEEGSTAEPAPTNRSESLETERE